MIVPVLWILLLVIVFYLYFANILTYPIMVLIASAVIIFWLINHLFYPPNTVINQTNGTHWLTAIGGQSTTFSQTWTPPLNSSTSSGLSFNSRPLSQTWTPPVKSSTFSPNQTRYPNLAQSSFPVVKSNQPPPQVQFRFNPQLVVQPPPVQHQPTNQSATLPIIRPVVQAQPTIPNQSATLPIIRPVVQAQPTNPNQSATLPIIRPVVQSQPTNPVQPTISAQPISQIQPLVQPHQVSNQLNVPKLSSTNMAPNNQPQINASSVVQKVCNPKLNLTGVIPTQTRNLTAAEQQSILAAHNQYRSLHGLKGLEYDNTLAQNAQEWANQLASQNCQLEHQSGLINQGENLAYFAGQKSDTLNPVANWYNERCDYERLGNYQNPTADNSPGHFTQVVWKDTNKLGCGYATCDGNQQVWVCRYSPPGNYVVRQMGESSDVARSRVYREQILSPI